MNDGAGGARPASFSDEGKSVARGADMLARAGLYCVLIAAVAITAYAAYRLSQDRASLHAGEDRLVASRGLVEPVRKHLAREYSDAQGRLLADAPSDPAKCLNPQTLVLAHYIDADEEAQLVDWVDLQATLGEATGQTIVGQEYTNSADDVSAIKAGTIHLVALHAADAPYLVNYAGFVPVAVLGTEAGATGNHLDIAVSAKSPIRTLAEVRGHTLTCTRPDSITGYRAAIAVLSQQAGLRPYVDYGVVWSYGQKTSVLGLVEGKMEVAALSDDKLQTMLQKGTVQDSDYRLIYQSEVIPRLTIGYVYNLQPERAAQVTSAILDFENRGGPSDEATGKPMRFFATAYKKDFEFVRKIDDSFDPRFGNRLKKRPTPLPDENTQSPPVRDKSA